MSAARFAAPMSEGRAVMVLALFAMGLVAGVAVQRVTDTGGRENPYPSLDRVEEPAASAAVAVALLNNDPKALARLLEQQTLQDLRTALTPPSGAPLVDIRAVRFVGATAKGSRVVAGYVVTGKDMQGTDSIVGLVLDIENGQIVGVN